MNHTRAIRHLANNKVHFSPFLIKILIKITKVAFFDKNIIIYSKSFPQMNKLGKRYFTSLFYKLRKQG